MILHLPIYNFTTVAFLLFLSGVAVIYRLTPRAWRAVVLCLASYFFYFSWNRRMTLLLLASTVFTYVAALLIERTRNQRLRRLIMAALVAGLITILAIFKAPREIQDFIRRAIGHPYLDLAMPLGISYYTFKLLSYVIDVYWGNTSAEKRFIRFAAYAAFFPQMVAGPIQRSETFLPQIDAAPPANFRVVLLGVQRIVLGFFKKFVVANNLGLLVTFVFGHLYNSGTPLLLGYYGFTLQLYADFSGLADIAIGAAWLLGIESPENFDAPFSAVNISEFWRRWHITLTKWLTDYVFTPLRMSTRNFGNAGLVFSLFVNMILIGLWHGFRWTFVVFGAIHGVYLTVDALTARRRKRYYKTHPAADRLTNWTGPVITFHLVALTLVFFRSQTIGDGFYFLAHLFQGIPSVSPEFRTYCHYLGLSMLAGFWAYAIAEAGDYLRRRNQKGYLVPSLPRWARWSVYSCTATSTAVLLVLVYLAGASSSPFLYAIF